MSFKLPFGWLPGHWGLAGHIRQEAKILYEISDPYEQEKELAKLKLSGQELDLKLLDIDWSFKKIASEYDYEIKKVELLNSDKETIEKEKLKLNHKYEKITDLEYEKELALLNKEPWVGVKNSSYDPKSGLGGLEFELDWNEYFITYLTENGYKGLSDQQVVEMWFNDLCKSVVAEEGIDEYITALENGAIVQSSSGVVRKDIDGDRTEFS